MTRQPEKWGGALSSNECSSIPSQHFSSKSERERGRERERERGRERGKRYFNFQKFSKQMKIGEKEIHSHLLFLHSTSPLVPGQSGRVAFEVLLVDQPDVML